MKNYSNLFNEYYIRRNIKMESRKDTKKNTIPVPNTEEFKLETLHKTFWDGIQSMFRNVNAHHNPFDSKMILPTPPNRGLKYDE